MFILRLYGWKIDRHIPVGVKKCVVVMGPHTSNWDFVIGKMAFTSYRINAKFLIKKEVFIPPFGWLLKWMGGIPVDRKGSTNLVDSAVKHFENNESLYMVFTPEGTRSYNPNWKKGFYHIPQKANVPIYIGYMDYEKRTGGFHSLFEPTGHIKSILKQFKGKYPENGID